MLMFSVIPVSVGSHYPIPWRLMAEDIAKDVEVK